MLILRIFIILLGVLANAMGIHASIRSDHVFSRSLNFHQAQVSSHLSIFSSPNARNFFSFHTSVHTKQQPNLLLAEALSQDLLEFELDDTSEVPSPFKKPQADNPYLLDSKAERHILDGDETGGGHRFGTGRAGKSEFPETWSDAKIKFEILDIATDPVTLWSKPDARGYVSGEAEREGIIIRVIYDSRKSRIVTAYPTNLPKNTR